MERKILAPLLGLLLGCIGGLVAGLILALPLGFIVLPLWKILHHHLHAFVAGDPLFFSAELGALIGALTGFITGLVNPDFMGEPSDEASGSGPHCTCNNYEYEEADCPVHGN